MIVFKFASDSRRLLCVLLDKNKRVRSHAQIVSSRQLAKSIGFRALVAGLPCLRQKSFKISQSLLGFGHECENLAPAFQTISRLNPFFYVISGFRFGFLGQSDIGSTNLAVLHSAIGLGLLNVALAGVTYAVLRSGWRIKS